MISEDLLAKLRVAAALAVATTACSRREAPDKAEPETPVVAAPPASSAQPSPASPAAADLFAADGGLGVGLGAPDGGNLRIGSIGRLSEQECPGCGMGGNLDHRLGSGGKPAAGVCTVGPTEPEVRRERARFQACYTRALNEDPKAGGKVLLRLEVHESGRVTKAVVVESTGGATLERCLQETARRLVLKPGSARSIDVPLVFRHDHR